MDVAKRVARSSVRVVWKHPLWANVPTGLRRGLFDVSIGSMTVTPDRKKLVAFTGPYYYGEGQVFVKTGGTQITGPGDLADKTVGVQDESTWADYLAQNTEAVVETYSTDLAAVTDLANGTIDFWIADPFTGQKMIVAGQQIQSSGKPLYYEDLAFALKRGESDWRALLNYTVKKMHKDGSLTTLSKKWYAGLDLTVKQSQAVPVTLHA